MEKAKSKILNGQEMFNQLINTTNPDVIIKFDLHGDLLDVSDTVQLTYGYERESLIGRSCFDFIHPRDIGAITIPIASGEMEIATFTLRLKNAYGQYIWSEITISVIRNPRDHQPIELLSICRDITSRKKIVDQLIETENLSVIGQLAAGLAHEIRNPLTTVKGFLQLLLSETVLKKEYLTLMQSEIERIEQITEELMLLSKPSVYHMQGSNIIKIIKEVILLLETAAYKAKVQICSEITASSIAVCCDEKKIKQVFINLIKNGIEAMPAGGTLKINILANNTRKVVEISIIDEGCGISAAQLEKIGQPFFTTKQRGNGLGLMMSSKIIG